MRKRALFFGLLGARASRGALRRDGFFRASLVWCAVLSGSLLAGCGSTPTLPLPPPVALLGAPDLQGLVTVQGEANEDAYVNVFNEQTDSGKITHAAASGHFSLQIAATVGDTLVIWQETDGVAGERTEQTVPAQQTP